MNFRTSIFVGIGLLFSVSAFGQNELRRTFESYANRSLQEKIFVHTDRDFYVVGETMWFKFYNIDGQTQRPIDVSKVAYLELMDASRTPVLQTKVSLQKGAGHGMVVLPTSLPSGKYIIRSYTSWMKNFSAEHFFEKTITIANTFTKVPTTEIAHAFDLQLFPEGGHLVQNLKSRIAFRGINESGRGTEFTGAVINQKKDTVARFQPLEYGMGTFELTPQSGDSYQVYVREANGQESTHAFPAVQSAGVTFTLKETTPELLEVQVQTTQEETIHLLVHTRQSVCHTDQAVVQGGKFTFRIPKAKLGEGITHLTVFNTTLQPVCERLYFKRPQPKLNVAVTSSQPTVGNREKVTLSFDTADSANVSVAVYQLDSLSQAPQEDIRTYFWLSSDLKGTIEQPARYLDDPAANADLLMLTHGWSRFQWKDVFTPKPRLYLPEYNSHLIYAKITSGQQPVPNAEAYLAAPGKDIWLYPALSDSSGRVFFEMRHFSGLNEVVVQTADSLNEIELESPYASQVSSRIVAPLRFNPSLKNQLLERSINMQVRNAYQSIYKAPVITDTTAFYGIPDKTYFLDDYTRFPLLEEVMREYVPEVDVRVSQGKFRFLMVGRGMYNFTKPPMVLLDGVPMKDINKLLAIDPLRIRRLDVISKRYFLGPLSFDGIVSFRSYKGDIAGFQPEALITSYEGVQNEREFYAPRYELKDQKSSRIADFRTLLQWTPTLSSSRKVDFYTSDVDGTFQVVVQGMTPDGKMGSKTYTFEVKKAL